MRKTLFVLLGWLMLSQANAAVSYWAKNVTIKSITNFYNGSTLAMTLELQDPLPFTCNITDTAGYINSDLPKDTRTISIWSSSPWDNSAMVWINAAYGAMTTGQKVDVMVWSDTCGTSLGLRWAGIRVQPPQQP